MEAVAGRFVTEREECGGGATVNAGEGGDGFGGCWVTGLSAEAPRSGPRRAPGGSLQGGVEWQESCRKTGALH